jgi:hypothetical protein
MRLAVTPWDVVTPAQPGRVPGVRMAGFNVRTAAIVDLQVVPYPAVTVFVDLGDGLLVGDASACGPGSAPRSASRPNEQRSSSASTTRPTAWPRATPRPSSRRRLATPTSPTCTETR